MTNVEDTLTPTLLVPVALEALIVNDPINNEYQFSRWQPAYQELQLTLVSPLPDPFNDQGTPPAKGVYLHWVLPEALTDGGQVQSSSDAYFPTSTSETSANYPLVPNRWLVARIWTGANSTQRNLKAWMVQSDYLGTPQAPGSNNFVTPTNQTFELTTLGKHFDLASWSEPSSPPALFLQAVGPGNVAFAAHTSEVMDVFAFCDTLADLPSPATNSYSLSYVVIGWYSDPSKDILADWTTTEDWSALMEALNWATTIDPTTLPVAELPKQTFYHGMVYGVNWQNQSVIPRPDATKMQLAVGNTGIDAFAALLEQVGSSNSPPVTVNQELMEAFQYSLLPLLNEADGAAQLKVQTLLNWYGSDQGGIYWKVVPTERSNLDDTTIVTAEMTPAQVALLAQLNATQTELNQAFLQLQSRQSQLYDLWWKQQVINMNGYSEGNYPEVGFNNSAAWDQISNMDDPDHPGNIQIALDATQPDSVFHLVQQLNTTVTNLVNQVPDPSNSDSIASYAQNTLKLPDTLQLVAVPMSRFYQPTDPVLMIGGIEWPDRYIYGGITGQDEALPTRIPQIQNQTITGMITGLQVGNTTIKATDSQLAGAIPLLGQNNLPAGAVSLITLLLQEAFFVDPASAGIIAAKYGLNQPDVTTAIANQTQSANYPASLSIFQWQQAWSPLFLEWEVIWCPTDAVIDPTAYNPASPTPPSVPTTTAPINWTFDGLDYTWGGDAPTNDSRSQTYKGRIFLSPHVTFGFIARLQQYLINNPNDPNDPSLQAIQTLITKVGEWNFLSQSLSGFCDYLIMQDISQGVPPDSALVGDTSEIPSYIGASYQAVPFTSSGNWGDRSLPPSQPSAYFFPIRAGHFMFNQLRVVDRFGQIVNLLQANNNGGADPNAFSPICGKGLQPDSSSVRACYLKQPPRLVQPAQLDFHYLSASDDTQQTTLNPDANPVCGWLLPNHLDQSLAVYDAAGKPLGELMTIVNPQGNNTLSWQPTPGSTPPVTPAQISNPHLQQFVQGILELNDQGAGLKSLLQAIDSTLWTVDPLGGRGDQELSVLIGRPIAVVRALAQFQLTGDPAADQAWSQTQSGVVHGTDVFTNVEFAVNLGSLELYDDGLLGYFLNDNYGQVNTVHPGNSNSTYTVAIGVNNNYIQLPINYPGKPNNQQALLTMLLDPRGCVHATTGIQPPQKLILPAAYTSPASQLNVTFRVNSLLTDADAIRLPIPALKQGNWSWIERSDPATWDTTLPIVAADQKPRLADVPPTVRDGWLQLQDNPES